MGLGGSRRRPVRVPRSRWAARRSGIADAPCPGNAGLYCASTLRRCAAPLTGARRQGRGRWCGQAARQWRSAKPHPQQYRPRRRRPWGSTPPCAATPRQQAALIGRQPCLP